LGETGNYRREALVMPLILLFGRFRFGWVLAITIAFCVLHFFISGLFFTSILI